MRLKKGSKVEVLSKRDVPSGSWFRAEIISGNGHYYNVKYDYYLPDGGQAMEKVQRKAIRPCPPANAVSRTWVRGDIVEVFENNSWKPAEVIKVLDCGNYSVVALIGSFRKHKLDKSNIRLRQSWKENRWILVDKESEGKMEISSKVEKLNHQRVRRCVEMKNCKGDDQFHIENGKCADVPYQILRGLKKRSSNVETLNWAGVGGKMGAVNKEGKRQKLLKAHSSKFPEKGQSRRPAKLASVGPRCCYGVPFNGFEKFSDVLTLGRK